MFSKILVKPLIKTNNYLLSHFFNVSPVLDGLYICCVKELHVFYIKLILLLRARRGIILTESSLFKHRNLQIPVEIAFSWASMQLNRCKRQQRPTQKADHSAVKKWRCRIIPKSNNIPIWGDLLLRELLGSPRSTPAPQGSPMTTNPPRGENCPKSVNKYIQKYGQYLTIAHYDGCGNHTYTYLYRGMYVCLLFI